MPVTTRQVEETLISGEWNCVRVLAPSRGIINRLIVRQLTGSEDGFSVDVLDRYDAGSAISKESGGFDDIEGDDKEIHRVLPRQTETGLLLSLFQLNAAYINQDERPVSASAQPYLYFDIRPQGNEDKLFRIAYTILPVSTE